MLFRLIGPLFSGIIIYTLILLLYNNIEQILSQFISQELFICVLMAYLISESGRLVILLYPKIRSKLSPLLSTVSIVGLTMAISLALVLLVLYTYYDIELGYSPNIYELQVFITLYLTMSIVIVSVYLSGYFLKAAYTSRLRDEENLRKRAREDFHRFARGINPDLLFESLEAVIAYLHHDRVTADQIIDDLSLVYRYNLTKGQTELIPVQDELEAISSFINLLKNLPFRKIDVTFDSFMEVYIVPGSVLHCVEQIVRTSIPGDPHPLHIHIGCDESIFIKYRPHEKLTESLNQEKLNELQKSYMFYADQIIEISERDDVREIRIPLIQVQSSVYECSDH